VSAGGRRASYLSSSHRVELSDRQPEDVAKALVLGTADLGRPATTSRAAARRGHRPPGSQIEFLSDPGARAKQHIDRVTAKVSWPTREGVPSYGRRGAQRRERRLWRTRLGRCDVDDTPVALGLLTDFTCNLDPMTSTHRIRHFTTAVNVDRYLAAAEDTERRAGVLRPVIPLHTAASTSGGSPLWRAGHDIPTRTSRSCGPPRFCSASSRFVPGARIGWRTCSEPGTSTCGRLGPFRLRPGVDDECYDVEDWADLPRLDRYFEWLAGAAPPACSTILAPPRPGQVGDARCRCPDRDRRFYYETPRIERIAPIADRGRGVDRGLGKPVRANLSVPGSRGIRCGPAPISRIVHAHNPRHRIRL